MSEIQSIIVDAFENRAEITPRNVSTPVRDAVMAAIEQLDRGEIREGYHADLVVFDPETIGCAPVTRRYDLPGGGDYRLYAEATGIDHVLVNGVEIVRKGEHTGALPGTLLRCGRDTRTVAMDALRMEAA